mgnify:CR=1 FL=1
MDSLNNLNRTQTILDIYSSLDLPQAHTTILRSYAMQRTCCPDSATLAQTIEGRRLQQQETGEKNWYRWGPYLSERQWGTVREDYSADGEPWDYLVHDDARRIDDAYATGKA